MKKLSFYVALAFGGMYLLTACNNAEYSVTDNAVYISEAQDGNLKKVTMDDTGAKATLTVRSAAFYDKDVNIEIEAASEQELTEFNKRNGTAYVALPADNYTLSSKKVVIKKGQVTASTVEVNINPLTEEQINSGDKFVLPLAILSADENVLANAKCMFYSIDQVIITSAPYLEGASINIDLHDANIETLPWTLEYRIWVSSLSAGNGGTGAFSMSAGPATEIYLRWGDANVPNNLIMMKTQGSQFISTKPAKGGQWYHHAWVHDGTKVKLYINGEYDTEMDSPGKISKIGNPGLFGSKGFMWSEWRFWSVARTQKQIKENMFSVSPQSEGLEIYFKLNEGKGMTFKESVGKYENIDGKANKDIQWRTIRSDEQ